MNKKTVLDVSDLSNAEIGQIFLRAQEFKNRGIPPVLRGAPRTLALLFLEDSTRTRLSFEIAAQRLGLATTTLISPGSSLSKGETDVDTYLNVAAMGPDAIVIRAAEDPLLEGAIRTSSVPTISGGWGARAHVTQGLLDAFTLQEHLGSLEGRRIVIVGDIAHSRVAASNVQLLQRLGMEVGVLGPSEYMSPDLPDVRHFSARSEALAWTHALMALRIQFERHEAGTKALFSPLDYVRDYGIRREHLQLLPHGGCLLHPGPINVGVELDRDVMEDPRSLILRQVTNGVFVRAALLEGLLK